MTFDGRNGRRGLGTLLRDLADGSAALVRGEARLISSAKRILVNTGPS